MPQTTHKYSRENVTVIWQPQLCTHSGICARGLAEVFDPRRRPWIDMTKATTEAIIEQVKKCPSGALSILIKEDS